MNISISGQILELVTGDITHQSVDAVVNAANTSLAGGAGVDGAIHSRGGPSIMEDTQRRYPKGCPTGSAVVSTAGDLPAKYVIHAVGPIWRGGTNGESDQLASAYRTSMKIAIDLDCQSIAFPAISTGVYGYPLDQAAEVSLNTVAEVLRACDGPALVRFVLFSQPVRDAFEHALTEISGD